jgi:hypothetical protein
MSSSIVRFDREEFIFNESEFELKQPEEYTGVAYKPITSKILYKNEPLKIRFPLQYGYGLGEIKSDKKTIEDKGFSFTYYKKEETEEDKRFNKFVTEFEKWYKKAVVKIAEDQLKKPTVFKQKLAKELTNPDSIKPFFCFPKDKDTKEVDKTKTARHYIKFRTKGTEPNCDVLSLDNAKSLKSTDVVSTETQKCTGQYVLIVRIKGFFFKSSDDYSAMLQTVGEVVCYRKNPGYDPLDIMGADYKPSDKSDGSEDDDDTVLEKNMLKKMAI